MLYDDPHEPDPGEDPMSQAVPVVRVDVFSDYT
jgi:hypothetical protein